MKTETAVGRLITHFSKWRESSARVAAMLLLLCTTAIPAWATSSWNTTRDDEGGGTVRYRGDDCYMTITEYSGSFETKKTFNPDNNQFYWEFTVFAGYGDYFSEPHKDCEYSGEIYVMTADSQAHSIANWKKEYLY